MSMVKPRVERVTPSEWMIDWILRSHHESYVPAGGKIQVNE